MSRNNRNNKPKYLKQVLGKDLWIEFKDPDDDLGANQKHYKGMVRKVREETSHTGEYEVTHFITFEDDDEGWYDLVELDEKDLLAWKDPSSKTTKSTTKKKKKKIKTTTTANFTTTKNETQRGKRKEGGDDDADDHERKKKAKTDDDFNMRSVDDHAFDAIAKEEDGIKKEEKEDSGHGEVNDPTEEEHLLTHNILDPNLDESSFNDSDFVVAVEEEDSDVFFAEETEEEETTAFNDLDADPRLKSWIGRIGLKDSYGKEDNAYGMIRTKKKDRIHPPDSFEFIFKLADYLYPGRNYHDRLFKGQSRPGISIRQILRDQKSKDPTNPALNWHQKKKPWIPPTKRALIHIVEVIISK